MEGVQTFVVDNASTDDSVASIDDLPVDVLALSENRGFGAGCNAGWRRGIVTLRPLPQPGRGDRRASLRQLVEILDTEPGSASSGRGSSSPTARLPTHSGGSRGCARRTRARSSSTGSSRELPGRTSSFATGGCTSTPASPDWVSGACMLVRRSVLEEIGGLRRALLPLLRGQGPLPADPRRRLRRPLRAAGDRPASRRRLGTRAPASYPSSPAAASPTPRKHWGGVRQRSSGRASR